MRNTLQTGDLGANERNPLSRTGGAGGLFLLVLAPYLFLLHRFWFVTDDAFISFRYARNLAEGHGLRYNLGAGAPVEGYSNFLWVLLCSLFELLHLPITVAPLVVSAFCGVLLLYLLFRVLRDVLGVGLPVAFLAALSLAAFPPFALWASGGLATMPFALLTFVTFERLLLRREGPAVVGGTLSGIALSLIRIEGFAIFLCIALLAIAHVLFSRRRHLPALAKIIAAVLLPYAAYFLWRYIYYGMPFPATVYAKAGHDLERLLRGADYVVTFFIAFISPLVLLPATAYAFGRGRRRLGLPIAAMAWLFPLYALAVTGDFMAMGRFLVPGFAFTALLVGYLWKGLWGAGRGGRGAVVVATALLIAVALLPAWNVHLVPQPLRRSLNFRHGRLGYQTEYDRWKKQVINTARWTERGKLLGEYARHRGLNPTETSFVSGTIGAVGYYSRLFIYDANGLVTLDVALREVDPYEGVSAPGHDKRVPYSHFSSKRPTILLARVVSDADPRGIAGTAGLLGKARADRLEGNGLEAFYVPDIFSLGDTDGDGVFRYLVTWLLVDEGEVEERLMRFKKREALLERGVHLPPEDLISTDRSSAPGVQGPENVLLIIVDALRADVLGCYGAPAGSSPHIDSLAAGGVRFRHCVSQAPWTLPSVATVMTGQYPSTHGANRIRSVLTDDLPVLAEEFQANGFATGAVVSHMFVGRKKGFARGFDFFDMSNVQGLSHVSTDSVTSIAIDWIERTKTPFFLFLHYFDPHYAYIAHEGFTERRPDSVWVSSGMGIWELRDRSSELDAEDLRYLRELYAGEVRLVDSGVGRILSYLDRSGLSDETLVVLTADHGEELMEHGWIGHTRNLYGTITNVPLILAHAPSLASGVREDPALLIDVRPTILGALGIACEGSPGRDLFQSSEPQRPLFSEVSFLPDEENSPPGKIDLRLSKTADLRSVQQGRWKAIVDRETGLWELYDVEEDPGETEDRAAELPDTLEVLQGILASWQEELEPGLVSEGELTAEEVERLRSLGYLR